MAPHRVDDPTLPPPWQALYDPSSSLKYYWNPNSGETTYTRPGDIGPKAELSNVLSDTARIGNGKWERPVEQDAFANGHKSSGPLTTEEYRRKHDLEVIGEFVPDPFQTFEDSGYTPDILEEIRRAGFTHPTPIQAQAWPVAVNGQDLVAIAKTGSGKTCGFLLPGLMHIKSTRKDPRMGPTILVLAPTRELAMQIKQEADKFGRSAGIRNTCVYGGAPKGPQLADLRSGVSIVIATPGRLNDYLEMRQVNLTQVSFLVLDEADRMLDMGFEPQIQKIVRTIPQTRQTLFFSATWPKEVKSIAAQFVTNRTVHIFIGGVEEKLVANKSITQHTLMLESNQKSQELHKILRSKPPGTRIIIFANTKRMCDNLARDIDREFRAAAIHGDKKQSERDYMLSSFKSGRTPILVATDVAARGLDIPHVSAVVNYDFPPGVEDYIHRIGRTGRAGATGDSFTFFTSSDSKYARELVQVLRDAGQMVPPQLEQMSMYGGGGGGRNRWGNSRGYGGGGGGRGYGGGGGGGGHGGGGFGNSNFTPIGGGPSSAGAGHAPYSMSVAPRGGDRGRDFGRDSFRDRRRSRSRSRDRLRGR